MSDLVRLDLERRDEVVVARVSGELDVAGTPSTREAIGEAVPTTARGLVVDFSELEFIDSSGLRTLLTARRRAEDAGAAFSLIAGHRGLERTLEIAGVHKVFTWTPAEEIA